MSSTELAPKIVIRKARIHIELNRHLIASEFDVEVNHSGPLVGLGIVTVPVKGRYEQEHFVEYQTFAAADGWNAEKRKATFCFVAEGDHETEVPSLDARLIGTFRDDGRRWFVFERWYTPDVATRMAEAAEKSMLDDTAAIQAAVDKGCAALPGAAEFPRIYKSVDVVIEHPAKPFLIPGGTDAPASPTSLPDASAGDDGACTDAEGTSRSDSQDQEQSPGQPDSEGPSQA